MKIKTYKLKLKTLSNLHIGSGETLLTFDYLIDNNKFYYIDENLLTSKLVENNLEDKFINIINNTNYNKYRNLKYIFNQLNIMDYKEITKKIYSGNIAKQRANRNIEKFIRNGNDELYIPGSSIKGFMSNVLKLNQNKAKNLSISDSKVINEKNIFITTVNYFSEIYGKKRKRNPLPKDGQSNYVEFIKPNTEVEFVVKMPEEYLTKFIKNLKIYNNNYYEHFIQHFAETNEKFDYTNFEEHDSYINDNVFRIGKYTNFLLKTEHLNYKYKSEYELFDKLVKGNLRNFFGTRINKRNREMFEKSDDLALYPISMKLSITPNNHYFENGVCKYSFEELKWD